MRLTLPTHDQNVRQELPDELYIGFVDNLLVEVRSLFLACSQLPTLNAIAQLRRELDIPV